MLEEVCSLWESQAERVKSGNCLVPELLGASMCRAEEDMGHHKLYLVLLFQSEASIAINTSCVILGC